MVGAVVEPKPRRGGALRIVATLALGLLMTDELYAAPPTADVETEAVIVVARQQDRLRAFASDMTELTVDRQIPRWAMDVCPFAGGLSGDANAFVSARLREVAEDAGYRAAAAKCKPNILILFSSEPAAMLKAALASRKLILPGISPVEQRRLLSDSGPVRWWRRIGSAAVINETPSSGGVNQPPELKGVNSRILQSTQGVIEFVVVIIDSNKASQHSLASLADYAAFVALTPTKSSVKGTPLPSIANLFEPDVGGDRRAMALTPVDRAYLSALAQINPERDGSAQIGQITALLGATLQTNRR